MPRSYKHLPLTEADAQTRVCTKCGEEKAIEAFVRDVRYRGGRKRICRVCERSYRAVYESTPKYTEAKRRWRESGRELASVRKRKLRYNFGISLADYDAMHAVQEGRCAICGRSKDNTRWGRLGVDHDHTSGVIRGLLCDPCNRGIGFFQDNPDVLERAAAYIRRSRSASAGAVAELPLAVSE